MLHTTPFSTIVNSALRTRNVDQFAKQDSLIRQPERREKLMKSGEIMKPRRKLFADSEPGLELQCRFLAFELICRSSLEFPTR